MDPVLTISFVIAFVLIALAVFGGMLVSKPKTVEAQELVPETLEAIAALSQPSREPEPVWTSPISTWERFSPLFVPVASFVVFVAALGVCAALYCSFGGVPFSTSAEDVAKTPASFPNMDYPEMRGVEPVQFKMPHPPKIDFSRKR